MSKLSNQEIDYIVETYKEVRSIAKTVEITGYSSSAVERYVKDISKNDRHSRNFINKIEQYDLKTGETINVWDKPATAAKELNINSACICRCLKGELKSAYKFGWRYAKDSENPLQNIELEEVTFYNWFCPKCFTTNMIQEKQSIIICNKCGTSYRVKNNIKYGT